MLTVASKDPAGLWVWILHTDCLRVFVSKHTSMALSLTLALATFCVAYLYPLYATYKVLTASSRGGSTVNAYHWYTASASQAEDGVPVQERPTEVAELESLCMYWAVMAVVRVVEALGEWLWRWCVFF